MSATINDLAAMHTTTAVTLVVPTERSGENRAFSSHVTRLLNQADTELTERLGKREGAEFVDRVRSALDMVDVGHLCEGLWVGATDDEVIVHHLDDPVEAELLIGDTLNLLPLVRQARRGDSLVLLLSEQHTDLLRFRADAPTAAERLRSLDAAGFPSVFAGEGGRQGRDTGSRQRDDRYRHWFRQIAKATAAARLHLPTAVDLPLVVVGIDRYLGFLTEVASGLSIDAVVASSPDSLTTADLDQRLTAVVTDVYDAAASSALSRVERLTGAGRTASDLANIANFAAQGRVATLVVDHDASDAMLAGVVVDVLAHAGEVHTALPGRVAGMAGLTGTPWVALLRW
jgi:hypothetical protein